MQQILAAFLQSTPFIPWLAIVLLALAVESLWSGEAQPAHGKLLNLANGFVICISVFVATPLFGLLAYAAARSFGLGFFAVPDIPGRPAISALAGGLFLIFVNDLLFYAWHRIEHAMPALWHIHAVHHSDTALNSTTYLRQHWLEALLQKFLIVLPILLLLKFTPPQAFVLMIGNSLLAFVTHMNVRWQLGRFSWLVTGPQLHRLHHSSLPQHLDRNFAQIFPLIDRLFGTYVAPMPGEFPPTGLAGGERIERVDHLLLWPFRKWLRTGKARRLPASAHM